MTKTNIQEMGGLPAYVKDNVAIMITSEYPSEDELQSLYCSVIRAGLFPNQGGRYLIRVCDDDKITIVLVTPDDKSLIPSSEFIDRMAENLRGELHG
jgi:hypothetical protein